MKKSEFFQTGLEKVLTYKRRQHSLTSWFVWQEIKMTAREKLLASGMNPDDKENQAELLNECVRSLPLDIPPGSILAGTQDDAFSPSYALINPAFKVENFAGYCDPLAVYDDITPDDIFTRERINKVKNYYASTNYVRNLKQIYQKIGRLTEEVVFFVEPVTGHTIPDMRPFLAAGVSGVTAAAGDGYKKVMQHTLEAAVILAERYSQLAEQLQKARADDPEEIARLELIAANCRRVPAGAAENLHQACQSFVLLWQVMCLEQAPNPYAFSVGNLDRILQPYLKRTSEAEAAQLVRHLLAFLMVGDRCWAISQNIMVGGKDQHDRDLTCPMSYVVLDAFYQSNCPQPALSVKLHRNTPPEFYQALGRFFFTPGHSTPSLFNDDAMFNVLRRKGIAEGDLQDYGIAGCQEPLIMGQENGNTTNSWLNLAKILEITINNGCSAISGQKLGLSWSELGFKNAGDALKNLENAFYQQLNWILQKMEPAANACTETLGSQAVPFTSALMRGLDSGNDMRDACAPGVKYSGSGCLVHGLSVVADSFEAVKQYLSHQIDSPENLISALQNDFKGADRILSFLSAQDKFGNNCQSVDNFAVKLAKQVSAAISNLRNPSGNHFLPDFSTPSTHLLYGYHVGATPDGRRSRTMLGYGIDPRPGCAVGGLKQRLLSQRKLNFELFTGGYASHLGLSSDDFARKGEIGERMSALNSRIIQPLFSVKNQPDIDIPPFYIYFNVDSASRLRMVLKNPAEYAPSGIYIMRIHGTFVNFLDLSPAIQQDIIERLDPESTAEAV